MSTAVKQILASKRAAGGKGAARAVRREGRVPAVIYGGGEAPVAISLDYKSTYQLIFAGHFLTTPFEIDVDGEKTRVLPRDYQLDPVRDFPLHVDFLRVKAGQELRVEVPVHIVGQEASPGLKRGGTLNIVRHTVEMWVPADNIPDSITADLTGYEINDSLHISAIKLPEGCRPVIADRDFTVITVVAPSGMREAEATAAAAPATAPAAPAAAPAAKK
ncbi:50S ribosomal protein L25/general stress protein Ctc [Alsobacter sp. SYSU M60028]|uniref:Large ribosomal subunit protein bL25 n=1 Tax=Alsobacter ponti TaxID=2962936 RepID=A0ABT1L6L5_9HYPH|nr:50S ribosomal protein L25/general stress protein Ctc [Alsobacter ponti]MCP8937045.1 50S ribosomal protein L25/general stress protein Ctc [Alsobacter ponti]